MDVRVVEARSLLPNTLADLEEWRTGMRMEHWGSLNDAALNGSGGASVAIVRWRGRVCAVCSFDPLTGSINSVVSTCPGKGLGGAALAAAEVSMRARGLREAVVDEVVPTAVGFYRKQGYTVRVAPYGRYEGALEAVKAL